VYIYLYTCIHFFKKSFGVLLAVLINALETMTMSTRLYMQNASAVGLPFVIPQTLYMLFFKATVAIVEDFILS